MALVALRQEADELRARLGEEPSGPVPFEVEQSHLPRAFGAPPSSEEEEPIPLPEETPDHSGGSVVPLPTRAKHQAPEAPEPSADVMADAMRDLQRIADEAREELGAGADEATGPSQPRMPAAAVPGKGNIGELVALRMTPESGKGSDNGKASDDDTPKAEEQAPGNAENRFFAALAEIRALKRAANQAGE